MSRTGTAPAQADSVDDDTLVTWWGLVVEGYARVSRRLADELQREVELPGPWFEVLLRLSRSPGQRLPLSQLAREVSFSCGGFTKLADRLVHAGLIARTGCASDRRVTYAMLTDSGAALLDRALRRHLDGLRTHVLEPLGPEALGQVAQAMGTLRDRCPE